MNFRVRDATYLNVDTDTGDNIIRSTNSLEQGLSPESDLLILMPKATQNEEETVESCRRLANRLNQIELCCKICLFPGEKSCFNLNCLAEFVHKVRAFHIVGVTEDLNLDIIPQVSAITHIPKQDLIKDAPVWGYIGDKHLVDVCSMGYTYRRDMPDGTVHTESRNLTSYHDALQPIWEERKSSKRNYLNQVLATVELINEWFSATPTGRVFSAAVMSDGTFNVPSGLYFSQPVRCVNHEWVPDGKQPLPQEELPLDTLYSDILPTLQTFQIGKSIEWIVSPA
uniref:Malate dehydrogenase 1B n=1 Tax=Cacopsylla melanoneura TaxID=428564 RepID=A0A8D9BM14_9HEMI